MSAAAPIRINPSRQRIGIIGGLGALGAADVFFKLVRATASASGREQPELMFEQQPFDEPDAAGATDAGLTARKLYVFDMIRRFEARRADRVLLPCFISHTFLDEIAGEVRVPVIDLREALVLHLQRRHPAVRRVGVLTSDRVRQHGLLDRAFGQAGFEVVHTTPEVQRDGVMPAIYGPWGIKAGHLQGEALVQLERACRDLMAQGAELIVPGFTEIAIVIESLRQQGLTIVDANQVMADHAAWSDSDAGGGGSAKRPFKVGVVGGVGPAATADFLQKIVHNTSAARDQDHVKLVVEQNPQIPDRTAHLIGDGPDPTVALYATCKKLEASDADLIAIPCNTAHAYVERIQPYLSIPIVNMLHETVRHLREAHPACRRVGLLATSGTLASRVYHEAFDGSGIELTTPDETNQARVMDAIYGERGVKAGFTEGVCREQLLEAMAHLVMRGAQAVILGCTELPLILSRTPAHAIAGTPIAILDPTDILARLCASLARRSRS